MNRNINTAIVKGAIVGVLLTVIWLLFAPKCYGQFSRPVWQPKDPCSEPRYRWVKKGVKYQEIKMPDSLNIPPERLNKKNPSSFKVGENTFIAWKGKIYIQINPKK